MTKGKSTRPSQYRSLDELVHESNDRVPLSTRVKSETKRLLGAEAKKRKVKTSAIAAAILDDYAGWLAGQIKAKA